jgi:hypothetical protein
VIRPSRGGDVIRDVMEDHRPQVWVADLFSSQKIHPAEDWQVCLAHQLQNCQYGISIVNTGKRQGLSAFDAIPTALNPLESLFSVN